MERYGTLWNAVEGYGTLWTIMGHSGKFLP